MNGGNAPYDPDLRRDTPLALKLKDRIARDGPISVQEYMEACLFDGDFGYYRTQAAIGKAGDFVTAPEISQVFGEILGLWAGVVWQSMGSPDRFNLVELGPGRGTLLRDGLRAARIVPGFADAANVHLVECNPVLIEEQKRTLAETGAKLSWKTSLKGLPGGPTILIGNEFLDTIPAFQSVVCADGVRERRVGLDGKGALQFVPGRRYEPYPNAEENARALERMADAAQGSIDETQVFVELGWELGGLAETGPLAALFIDYGHEELAFGDTMQAVRKHAYEHPLTSPGEADLTVQVDFHSFRLQVSGASKITRNAERRTGRQLTLDGPVTQAEFLGQLGIIQRASKLMSSNPAKAGVIETGILRLMAPNGMGTRFKAIGVRTSDLPELPGFAKPPGSDRR